MKVIHSFFNSKIQLILSIRSKRKSMHLEVITIMQLHDRDHFEVHAFSFGPDTQDELNLRIKEGVDHFHNVQSMSHKEIVEYARSLQIDIAVDLGGLTAESRTDVFAMSAAADIAKTSVLDSAVRPPKSTAISICKDLAYSTISL